MRPTKRRWAWLILGIAVAAVVVVGGVRQWSAQRLPKRFAAVVEGQLYRSGSVSPTQLERLYCDYGVTRVLCLLNPDDPDTQAEKLAAQRLGISWHNVPLPGNGASTPEDRRRILNEIINPQIGAVLVHCAAGTNRTGLAVGLYRLHYQDWPLEKVEEELRAFDFEDEPQHENLRQALAEEAAAQAAKRHIAAP